MSMPKRNINLLDFRQKREIVDYFTNHPKCTQQQIADYFTTLWDVPVKHRTVGDILANKKVKSPPSCRECIMILKLTMICN